MLAQAKVVERHQEDNLQLTRPRRSMNLAGTGLRGNADMVTSATSDMMHIFLILLQTQSHHLQRQPLHFYMMIAT
jgi:hypothetical protein